MNVSTLAISVIVPAYNEEKYLADCLRCLSEQDFNLPYEIVVVDNNSTDQTAQIAESFPKVRLIEEPNQGVVFAKQTGLLAARADIAAVCDADCRPPPNWLLCAYSSLQQEGVVGVTGPLKFYDGPFWYKLPLRLGNFILFTLKFFTGKSSYCAGCNVAFKKDALLKEGGYDVTQGFGADELGLWRKLKRQGIVLLDKDFTIYASGRRAKGGFWYTIFHDILLVWLFGSFINALLKKETVKQYVPRR